jgi:hypothetical protein
MKFIKPLNEYANAESENYVEVGLEGVSAKDILLNVYPKTFEVIVKDFDEQCDKSSEFKNRNLDMLRSIIGFFSKYHGKSKFMDTMIHKYNLK